MNIDLIIKLARLANENPNDNEANLAARKVCQLIKAAEYKFSITVRPESTKPSTSNTGPTYPNYAGVDFDPLDFLRNYAKNQRWDKATYEGSWDTTNEKYKRQQEEQAKYYQNKEEQNNYYYDPITGTNRRTSKPKRPLECTQCKRKIETAFVGVEATFVCHTCVWNNYMNQRP